MPVPPEEVFLYSYGTALLHEQPWDPASPRLGAGELAARVPERVGQWVPALGALRSKGFVETAEGLRLVQGVGPRVELTPPRETPAPSLVGKLVVIRRA